MLKIQRDFGIAKATLLEALRMEWPEEKIEYSSTIVDSTNLTPYYLIVINNIPTIIRVNLDSFLELDTITLTNIIANAVGDYLFMERRRDRRNPLAKVIKAIRKEIDELDL